MKYSTLILLFFFTSFVYGQDSYNSWKTENLKSGESELINRTITIEKNRIIIRTEVKEGYDIQTLKVLNMRLNEETNPPTLIYACSSLDEVYPSLILIPQRKIITEILITQPSLANGSDEHFRFYIDTKDKASQ